MIHIPLGRGKKGLVAGAAWPGKYYIEVISYPSSD
jgi:hypothetical protein